MHTGTIAYPKTAHPIALTARKVAAAYNFPMNSATGKGYTAGFIELGGGYYPGNIAAYFHHMGLALPSFTDVNVGEGSNTSDPSGANGEVQSDMIVAGSVAPDADYRIYFAGNSNTDFLAALTQAIQECDGVSISWGSAESNWDTNTMADFESAIALGRSKGVPVFVASGDSGKDDGTGSPVADFPASAPSAIGCGGTRLELNHDGTRASETLWNDDPVSSASGQGPSQNFPGRTVPDIAGNADPDTGYELAVDGHWTIIGGTSLVAPLMLGLHALLYELADGTPFDFKRTVLASPSNFYAVTGAGEGFGVPDGAALLGAIQG